jgi:uncharacterized SAM-binding protein YcdF (DUF218 family)
MKIAQYEAVVVHGGGLTPQEELVERAVQRMDTAISAWNAGEAPDMVVSGGYSFMLDEPPTVSEATVMKRYAEDHGVPGRVVHTEDKSLDTIGNALFTKTDIVEPNNWERLLVVTSKSHLPRTLKIFRHVMGNDFEITGRPAPEHVTPRDKVYELIGTAMMREVLRGTKPGDDEAIKERLFRLVPGYPEGTGTKSRLAAQSLLGLLKRH